MRRLFFSVSAALLVLAPSLAHAQALPPVICTGLPGCGKPAENLLYTGVLPTAAGLLIQIAGALAVIFIVFAGIQMAASAGDDGKISTAKKAIVYALGGLGIAITAATLVSFVTTENYGQANPTNFLFGAGGLVPSVIRIIMIVFDAGFFIVFFWAGMRMVLAAGNAEEFKKAGQMIRWAIVGAIIVNIAKAGVQALLAVNL